MVIHTFGSTGTILGMRMNEDTKKELKAWTKPEVVDVEASVDDIASSTGTSNDGFGGSSS